MKATTNSNTDVNLQSTLLKVVVCFIQQSNMEAALLSVPPLIQPEKLDNIMGNTNPVTGLKRKRKRKSVNFKVLAQAPAGGLMSPLVSLFVGVAMVKRITRR